MVNLIIIEQTKESDVNTQLVEALGEALSGTKNILVLAVNYLAAKNIYFNEFERIKENNWELSYGDKLQVKFPNGSVIRFVSVMELFS